MLCTIPFFAGDKNQAVRLAAWIRDLGGVRNHDCLLVVDEGTTPEGAYEPLTEAFRSVSVTRSKPEGAQGTWGSGTTDATAANAMFQAGAIYVFHKLKVPFFWLEPDAAPTRSTWLDEIEAAYKACGKPFMGMLVDMPPHEQHMSGIGCYPFDVANHSVAMMMPGGTAWDYAGRKDTVKKQKAHFTDLIQHVYRINGNVPEWPTFPTPESLSQIHPRAAVFHRCKDSTLIDRLREKLGEQPSAPEVTLTREGVLEARVKELEAQLESISNPAPGWRAQVNMAARRKKPVRKKRVLTEEHKASLRAALERARAAKARKVAA